MPKFSEGGVRWKRFAAIMVPAGLGVGGLLFATASGALASSFAISGSNFKVTADRIDGTGFVQYGEIIKPAGKGDTPVAVSAMKTAKISNMCQSVKLGPLTMRLTAGTDADNPVRAKNLVLDVSELQGNATFSNIEIGVDASSGSFDQGPVKSKTPGMFGQQADSVKLTNVRQTAWATTAGTFTLPNLKLGFGGNECY
jgi:uncharacterized protein DUF6230